MNQKETSPLAIASLAFSCLGAVTAGILAIPGIVCGCMAKRQVERGEYEGRSLAQAGIIVGVAVLILWLAIPLLIFGGVGFIALAVSSPWAAACAFGILLFLALLPAAFSGRSKRRDAASTGNPGGSRLWLTLPLLFAVCAGFVFLATKDPMLAAGVFGILISLVLLPMTFARIARHRDTRSLRKLVETNRSRE